jgi:hypothetical protein
VKKRSRLEIEKEAAAKENEKVTEEFIPLHKRRKMELEAYWSTASSSFGEVVIKKSKLELEKEASIR